MNALLSFCWPGLGQLCQGRMLSAIMWFSAFVFCILLVLALIGIALVPIVCVCSAKDAADHDRWLDDMRMYNLQETIRKTQK